MPYAIEKRGNKWEVVNKKTGKAHGTHSSREGALKQMRLLYMVEGGKQPTGKKSNLK